MIPTKKDIAFVEYIDEGSATVAKDALHNYKLDGENKIKASIYPCIITALTVSEIDHVRQEIVSISQVHGRSHRVLVPAIAVWDLLYCKMSCRITSV